VQTKYNCLQLPTIQTRAVVLPGLAKVVVGYELYDHRAAFYKDMPGCFLGILLSERILTRICFVINNEKWYLTTISVDATGCSVTKSWLLIIVYNTLYLCCCIVLESMAVFIFEKNK
jgi:hypothetical protein